MTITNNEPLHARAGQAADMDVPRLALIGCGAIAEKYHLPGLSVNPPVMERLILVDKNQARLDELSEQFNVRRQSTNLGELLEDVDAAVVATPPQTHHPICMELLPRGIHVMCEKPLAATAAEAREMTEVAAAAGALLCVNHTRRLFPANAAIRQLVADGTLGRLRSIHYVDGEEFTWSSVTGFHFRQGARGVLFDRGVHSLDLVCWWLDAKPRLVRAQTDSYGGPDSLATVDLQHDGCQIQLKLSWLTKLPNRYAVAGERATVSGGIEEWGALTLTHASGRSEKLKFKTPHINYSEFGKTMLGNFIEAVCGRAAASVPAADVIASRELLDECYAEASQLRLPWLDCLKSLQVQ